MAIWNLIFPSGCRICGNPFLIEKQNLYCPECIDSIERSSILYCRSCGRSSENCYPICENCKKERIYDHIHAFTDYSKVGDIIKDYKLNGYKSLYRVLSKMIREDLTEFVRSHEIQAVLYVPVSKKVLRKRGFNHLRILLLDILPSFLVKDWLIKIKETRYQMDLSSSERETNLIDAFSLSDDANFFGQNVMIFDDVLTTGSTLKQVAKVIKRQNIGKIYGYVIAKV